MHDDNEELDLKKLDNPDAPKPEILEPEIVQLDSTAGQPVVGKSRHPHRKIWVTVFLLLLIALLAYYWFATNKAVAPSLTFVQ
jgi:hypothetical protein